MEVEAFKEVLDKQIAYFHDYLVDNFPECFTDGSHKEENTEERAYYYLGYLESLEAVRLQLGAPNSATLQ